MKTAKKSEPYVPQLKAVNTTAKEPTDYIGSSPIFSRSHLADLGVKLDDIDCNTAETTDN